MKDKIKIEPNRPLVTFALFAFNQENYIREAVEGALNQTYSPLQIIISDDCSTDGTYPIIEEIVATYRGPHFVLVNRNKQNLGLGEHVNRVVEKSMGELIVVAAGDDVSLPERTETLVRFWLSNQYAEALCSSFMSIDHEGKDLDRAPAFPDWIQEWIQLIGSTKEQIEKSKMLLKFLRWDLYGLYGSTGMWTKGIFRKFGALDGQVRYEDRVIFFRALLDNSINYVPEKLVKYRCHNASLTNYQIAVPDEYQDFLRQEVIVARRAERIVGHLRQHLKDLYTARGLNLLNQSTLALLREELEKQIMIAEIRGSWWNTNIFKKLFSVYMILASIRDKSEIKWFVKRLLPLRIFCGVKRVKKL